MRVYVATAFANLDEARDVMSALRAAGHTITYDWTRDLADPSQTPAQQYAHLQACGANDFRGVVAAQAVLLINHQEARDAMVEFGIALGLRTPVWVLYPFRRPSVFFHQAALYHTLADVIDRARRSDNKS